MTTTHTRLEAAELVLASIARRDDDCGNAVVRVPVDVALDMPDWLLEQAARRQHGPGVAPYYLLPLNLLARFALAEEEGPDA